MSLETHNTYRVTRCTFRAPHCCPFMSPPPSLSVSAGLAALAEGDVSLLSTASSCLSLSLFLSVRRRRDEEARLRQAEDTLRDAVQQVTHP